MSLFRDALTWSDTAAIGYPALHQKLVELTMPALCVKQLLPEVPLVAGKSFTVAKQKGSRAMAISEVTEGSEIPMDFTPYTYINVIPYKKALRERVSRENIEDLCAPGKTRAGYTSLLSKTSCVGLRERCLRSKASAKDGLHD